jgi:thiol-disulfide isomerase/thioredoxin
MNRFSLLLLLLFSVIPLHAADKSGDALWYTLPEQGNIQLELYFFWSQRCPHCQHARPLIEQMGKEYAWLNVHSLEVNENELNRKRYQELARLFDQEARSVPAFFFCKTMLVGFESEAVTGRYILEQLVSCKERLLAGEPLSAVVPGEPNSLLSAFDLDIREMSLPVLTLVIAALDAFNPCAFFVLLFLLSLLVHARSRKRIFIIGGVYVLFSGVIYFLFMAAWLNVFLVMGPMRWVTTGAGMVAAFFALFNIKDYFFSGVGPTLSISEQAKPGLFKRMRNLLHADRMAALLFGTVVLAIAANSYELLCTSGLPMIYTRLLTLEQLPTLNYYLYLAAYNVIYVLPLLLIVMLFAVTLGARKLQAGEGRVLKLLSGMMMLGLALVLIIAPDRMSNIATTLGIVVAALLMTLLITVIGKVKHH